MRANREPRPELSRRVAVSGFASREGKTSTVVASTATGQLDASTTISV
jgi:hypothetical protein